MTKQRSQSPQSTCPYGVVGCPTCAWEDGSLPEDEQIRAAHPVRSGRHDLYAEAVRMVGAKRSKYALVELVNWLLHRAERP